MEFSEHLLGVNTYIHYGEFELFLNIKNGPLTHTDVTNPYGTPLTFSGNVGDSDTTLSSTLYYDSALSIGDFHIIDLNRDPGSSSKIFKSKAS